MQAVLGVLHEKSYHKSWTVQPIIMKDNFNIVNTSPISKSLVSGKNMSQATGKISLKQVA